MTTEYVPATYAGNPTVTQLNAELEKIRSALDNTLKRANLVLGGEGAGTFINQMDTELDMNGQKILNVQTDPNDPASLATIGDISDANGFDASAIETDVLNLQTGLVDLQTALGTLTTFANGTKNLVDQNQVAINANGTALGTLQTDVTNVAASVTALTNYVNNQLATVSGRAIAITTRLVEIDVPVTAPGFNNIFTAPLGAADFDILQDEDYVVMKYGEVGNPPAGWTNPPILNVTLPDNNTVTYNLQEFTPAPLAENDFPAGSVGRWRVIQTAVPGTPGTLRLMDVFNSIDDLAGDSYDDTAITDQLQDLTADVVAVEQALAALPAAERFQQMVFSFSGLLPDNNKVATAIEAIQAYANATQQADVGKPNGYVRAGIPPSGGDAVFTISANGTAFGTVTIADGANSGTIALSADTAIPPGTILTIDTVAQNGAEDVAITLLLDTVQV